jgi:23S rRNA (uridine2552-2'-O)-methyltransferase
MLHPGGGDGLADGPDVPFPRFAVVTEDPYLDQFVSGEAPLDLLDHNFSQAGGADHDHGSEFMGLRPEKLALGRCQFQHGWLRKARRYYMKRQSKTRAWHHRHVRDPFVRQAVDEGYRSRAAFKLMAIDDKDHLLVPGGCVVDLGCAPGGWCQVAAERLGAQGLIVGVDLLEMAPIPRVHFNFIRGDLSTSVVLAALEARLGGRRPDLVLSDMAPNISGVSIADQPKSYVLAELALDFAVAWLQPEGAFLVKVFQGAGFEDYVGELRAVFRRVAVRKPKASRGRSREVYLLGRGKIDRGPDLE